MNMVTPKAGAKHELLFNKPALDVPTLAPNILLVATNRTNIHNRPGGIHHESVYLMRCLWDNYILPEKVIYSFCKLDRFIVMGKNDLDYKTE
jgi:hypothetical protein